MPTPHRVSLTAIAEDDEPIQRTDLMAPTLPATEPSAPAPTPIAPPPAKGTRVVRQSREVETALNGSGSSNVLQLAEQMYGTQEEKDQISAWIKRWVNQGLEAAVREAEAKGYKKMTKSTIVQEALIQYLDLKPPTN